MRITHLVGAVVVAGWAVSPVLAQKKPRKGPDLAGIDAVVASIMKEWQVPGLALGIVKDGQVIYLKGYGLRDVEKQLPMTPQTRLAIGSNSKSFTVALMGMLADQKKLDWDKPVRQYLPDFKLFDAYASEKMTPRDLVNHRSGLPRHDLLWYGRNFNRKEIFDRLEYLEPNVSFREKWQYQNLMFLSAGVLVERITGRTWEDLVRDQIFAPLGMTRSLPGATGMDRTDDFAWPYMTRNGVVARVPIRNIDEVGPAGSITSSVEDMMKYVQFRISRGASPSGALLSKAAEDQMQSPQMVVGTEAGSAVWPGMNLVTYGLGLAVASYRGHEVVIHGGGIDGFISQMSWIPKEKLGVVVLTNLSPNPTPTMVVESIYDRLLGLEPIDWAAVQRGKDAEEKAQAAKAAETFRATQKQGTRPGHDLADYAGTYDHPGYGRIVVRMDGNTLAISMDAIVAPLRHFHYDVFEINDPGNIVPLSGLASFGTNLKGEVDQVSLPLEPNVKPIVFKRTGN